MDLDAPIFLDGELSTPTVPRGLVKAALGQERLLFERRVRLFVHDSGERLVGPCETKDV